MPQIWQFQEARKQLGKLVENALADGPQLITKYGGLSVIVLSVEEYRSLTQRRGVISSEKSKKDSISSNV